MALTPPEGRKGETKEFNPKADIIASPQQPRYGVVL